MDERAHFEILKDLLEDRRRFPTTRDLRCLLERFERTTDLAIVDFLQDDAPKATYVHELLTLSKRSHCLALLCQFIQYEDGAEPNGIPPYTAVRGPQLAQALQSASERHRRGRWLNDSIGYGVMLIHAGDCDEAIQVLRSCRSRDPLSADARYFQALAELVRVPMEQQTIEGVEAIESLAKRAHDLDAKGFRLLPLAVTAADYRQRFFEGLLPHGSVENIVERIVASVVAHDETTRFFDLVQTSLVRSRILG